MSKYITRKHHDRIVKNLKADVRVECRRTDSLILEVEKLKEKLSIAETHAERANYHNRDLESRKQEFCRKIREVKNDMIGFDTEVMPNDKKELVIERQYGRTEGLLRALLDEYDPQYGTAAHLMRG